MTFGAHRCLQVLSLGFGAPWERKGRETKGFWGWGSVTQVQVRGWSQVWARLGCTVWGCWGMRVAQLEEASLPGSCRESQGAAPRLGWGLLRGCCCSLTDTGLDPVLGSLPVLLGVPEQGQGQLRDLNPLGLPCSHALQG